MSTGIMQTVQDFHCTVRYDSSFCFDSFNKNLISYDYWYIDITFITTKLCMKVIEKKRFIVCLIHLIHIRIPKWRKDDKDQLLVLWTSYGSGIIVVVGCSRRYKSYSNYLPLSLFSEICNILFILICVAR